MRRQHFKILCPTISFSVVSKDRTHLQYMAIVFWSVQNDVLFSHSTARNDPKQNACLLCIWIKGYKRGRKSSVHNSCGKKPTRETCLSSYYISVKPVAIAFKLKKGILAGCLL